LFSPETLGEMDTLLLDFNGTGLERGQFVAFFGS
jgi:hypothetical protein